jgi:hypothetical protein
MFKQKSTHYFFLLTFTALILLGTIFYTLLNVNNDKKLISTLEHSLSLTKNLLEEQKRYALSLSVLISEDEAFLQSFDKKDRQLSFDLLNRKIKRLKQLQNSHFEVQVHNSNLTTYLRSWDFSIKDVPLSSFRQGLVQVKKTLQPLTSIELGKRLNIKAITPILKKGEFMGSIEVIIGFDHLQKELEQRGFKPYILLHNKYLNIASTLQNHPKIQNFTLVNTTPLASLKHMKLESLKDYGYFTQKEYAFSYFTYYSLKREKLGYIIIELNNEDNIMLNNTFENTITNTSATKVIIQ